MTAGLSRNTETLGEHRLRLQTLGYQPLSRQAEMELFPNEEPLTPAQEKEVWHDWNRRYPRGRKTDRPEYKIVFNRWAIKVVRGAYSPIKRLKTLVLSLKRRTR